MTPQEKAKDICTKINTTLPMKIDEVRFNTVNRLALIFVDEIISAMNDLEDVSINLDGSFTWQNAIDDYWIPVKQEIEKYQTEN